MSEDFKQRADLAIMGISHALNELDHLEDPISKASFALVEAMVDVYGPDILLDPNQQRLLNLILTLTNVAAVVLKSATDDPNKYLSMLALGSEGGFE